MPSTLHDKPLASATPWAKPLDGALPRAIDAELTTIDTAGAGRLAGYVDRAKSGRPLVLLHSINAAASSCEMRPLFETYRHERPVFALDWPGFGLSSRDRRNYDAPLYRLALERFLIDVVEPGSEGADVIALSLGGEFAAHLAVTRPALFRSLTLVSPTGLGQKVSGPGSAARALSRNSLTSRLAWAALSSAPSLRYFLKKSFRGPVDAGLLAYAQQTVRVEGASRAPLDFLGGLPFTPYIFTQVYERLRVPTLVLHDDAPYTSFERLSQLVARGLVREVSLGSTRGLPQFEALSTMKDALGSFWAERRLDPTSNGASSHRPTPGPVYRPAGRE